jgi:K+-transporting ATPase ATPase C chain
MRTLLISAKIFLIFTILTGVCYPLLITGIAQAVFPSKANGSLIARGNSIVGSELIGQAFDSCIYFMPRASAIHYDASCSGASNLSLTSTKLQQLVNERRLAFIAFNQLNSATQVPSEMLCASGSGLDPHISTRAALLQVDRIVKARNLDQARKQKLIELIKKESSYGATINEGRVNVLKLNIELDKI